ATTSAVALRLLAQVASEEGREVVLVADAAARALAAEAGIPAFASVADANAEGAVPAPAPPPAAAPIHVVRGEDAPVTVDEPPTPVLPAAPASARGMEETQAVRIPPPQTARPRPGPRDPRPRQSAAGFPLAVLAGLLALLVVAGAAAATVLPGANITIRRQSVAIGPLSYSVTPELHPSDSAPLESTIEGEASGRRTKRTAATGIVTFINYSDENVLVPAGTVVSAGGDILFQTTQEVVVPDSFFGFVGIADAPVAAVEKGADSNVESDAVNRIEDRDIDRALRGGGPDDRRVRNQNPIEGGEDVRQFVVRRQDVLEVTDAIAADLEQQLADVRAETPDRLYPSGDPPAPEITVPEDLIGHVSEEPFTFELTGQLTDDKPYVLRADAEEAAREQFEADSDAVPEGMDLDEHSVAIELGEATLEGEILTVATTVTAAAVPNVDVDALRQELAGKTVAEAEALLEPIGTSTVDLWPVWVDRIPQLDWRISIDVQAAESQS
ncbi:MAG TPA: baseplate J/gp47 family protein, partial [Candidatus Limnocylindria bacterium]|nr:baseplate J/gp47 family protein [Candidatus Limnocylindria bacterium]